MAATHVSSGTTTGNAVSTITFPLWYRGIEVVNRSSNDMWARFDGVDPTIAGDDCLFIPANTYITVNNPVHPPEIAIGVTATTTVKLITATASTYTVQAGV